MKLPRPSRVCISEKPPKYLEDVTLKEQGVHSDGTMVEAVSAPRPNTVGLVAGSVVKKKC